MSMWTLSRNNNKSLWKESCMMAENIYWIQEWAKVRQAEYEENLW